MTDFNLLTDEQIIKQLSKNFEQSRLDKSLSESEVSDIGGTNKDAIHRFKNGKNINLKNFIGILRGVGKLDELSQLFHTADSGYSPTPVKQNKVKKRIFNKNIKIEQSEDFIWGDDEGDNK